MFFGLLSSPRVSLLLNLSSLPLAAPSLNRWWPAVQAELQWREKEHGIPLLMPAHPVTDEAANLWLPGHTGGQLGEKTADGS